jgi:hypothetical protein
MTENNDLLQLKGVLESIDNNIKRLLSLTSIHGGMQTPRGKPTKTTTRPKAVVDMQIRTLKMNGVEFSNNLTTFLLSLTETIANGKMLSGDYLITLRDAYLHSKPDQRRIIRDLKVCLESALKCEEQIKTLNHQLEQIKLFDISFYNNVYLPIMLSFMTKCKRKMKKNTMKII